jgi:hypothetical protein
MIVFCIIGSLYLDYRFYYSGIIPILLSVVAFSIGYLYADRYVQLKNINTKFQTKTNIFPFSIRLIYRLVIVYAILGGVMSIYFQMLFLHLKLTSITDLLHIANRITELRYTGHQTVNKTVMLFQLFVYVSVFFGSLIFNYLESYFKKVVVLLPVLVMLLISILNTTRAVFIIALTIWISTYFAVIVYRNNGRVKSLRKVVVILSLGVLSLLAFLVFAQILRGGSLNVDLRPFINHVAPYIFGHYDAFSIWWHNYDFSGVSYGKFTFSGLFDLIFHNREQGIYSDFVQLNRLSASNSSNIYTAFRGLIQDYTFPGMLLISFLSGVVVSFVYNRTKHGSIYSLLLLVVFYCFVLYSFLISFFIYNVTFFVWFLIFAHLLVLKLVKFPKFVMYGK